MAPDAKGFRPLERRASASPRRRNVVPMSEGISAFYDGAHGIAAVAVVPLSPHNIPMVVVVVDDSADDELVEAIARLAESAESEPVSAVGYDGAWDALDAGDHHTLKFKLARVADLWERAWTYIDPPRELVDAITSGDSHYVAVLPRELAGDLGDLNVASLAGALIVEVSMPPHAQAAVRALCGF